MTLEKFIKAMEYSSRDSLNPPSVFYQFEIDEHHMDISGRPPMSKSMLVHPDKLNI